MAELVIQTRARGVRFTVRVQPRASRAAVSGVHGGALRVRLQAPPVDGAANEALVDLLAERLEVTRSAIRIVSGMTGRTKRVDVDGIDAERVRRMVMET